MKLTVPARSLQADMQAELLTNSWGDRHYGTTRTRSFDAASLVYSKAAHHLAKRAPCFPSLSSLRAAAAFMVFDLPVSGSAR